MVRYSLDRPAVVTVTVIGAGGFRYPLQVDDPRPTAGDFEIDYDGTAPSGPLAGNRTVLPSGEYLLRVEARTSDGQQAEASTSFAIRGEAPSGPLLTGLSASPTTIHPNFSGIDDETVVQFRLLRPANVSTYVVDLSGRRVDVATFDSLEMAGLHSQHWTGVVDGRPLVDGTYQYTVAARDTAGNQTTMTTPIVLIGGAIPSAHLLRAEFEPHSLQPGDNLAVQLVLRNDGPLPLRSQGPETRFMYGSMDRFSSIFDGQLLDRRGFWRAGVGLTDGTDGAGNEFWLPGGSSQPPLPDAARYPYRWGFGGDLAPGDEVEIDGAIRLEHAASQLWAYAGLLQEGYRIHEDGVARTLIDVAP